MYCPECGGYHDLTSGGCPYKFKNDQSQTTSQHLRPFLCPVCNGTGLRPAGFYNIFDALRNDESEKCRSCNGTGIIWGKQ